MGGGREASLQVGRGPMAAGTPGEALKCSSGLVVPLLTANPGPDLQPGSHWPGESSWLNSLLQGLFPPHSIHIPALPPHTVSSFATAAPGPRSHVRTNPCRCPLRDLGAGSS